MERRYMQAGASSADGWDGRERRSHNPWIDAFMSELREIKDETKKQTELMRDVDQRLIAIEEWMPVLRPIAVTWTGASNIGRIIFWFAAFVAGIGTCVGLLWKLFQFVTGNPK